MWLFFIENTHHSKLFTIINSSMMNILLAKSLDTSIFHNYVIRINAVINSDWTDQRNASLTSFINPWFLNFSSSQDPLGGLVQTQMLGPTYSFRVSNTVDQKWDVRFCISQCPREVDAADPGLTFEKHYDPCSPMLKAWNHLKD